MFSVHVPPFMETLRLALRPGLWQQGIDNKPARKGLPEKQVFVFMAGGEGEEVVGRRPSKGSGSTLVEKSTHCSVTWGKCLSF